MEECGCSMYTESQSQASESALSKRCCHRDARLTISYLFCMCKMPYLFSRRLAAYNMERLRCLMFSYRIPANNKVLGDGSPELNQT